ncbi:MAG: glycerol-3-phosphate 1-O-acyltransferase PlsY [Planctomycetes bacterium]|nr:glycerol-3-phosphate 1-O-acyltransferase PlsY [Planctomycetota bacterium]
MPALNVGSPLAELLAALLAFLVGGVPFGWLFARVVKGVDLRTVGSGNVGATNASRLFTGRRQVIAAFVAVFLLDCVKGFVAAWWSPELAAFLGGAPGDSTIRVACGSAAILGHVFTPYLGFRGGKGVATALGVVTALATWSALYAVGAWGLVLLATGYVSLGSIVAMLTIPVTYWLRYGGDTFRGRLGIFVFLTACAAVVIWRHRSNIARLLDGSEARVGSRRRGGSAS